MTRKSPLDVLGGSMSRKSSRRSAFGALGNALKGKRQKGKGIAAQADYAKRSRGKGGLKGALKLGERAFGKQKRRRKYKDDKFALLAARAIADRNSPAERQEITEQVERAIENDRSLSGAAAEALLTQGTAKENFIQRLVSAVRKRMTQQVN